MQSHESSTQGAPALRTRDGGLKIFYDRSTLPTHPVPRLSCIIVYILFLVTYLGLFQNTGNCGSAKAVAFKGVGVML